MPNIDENDPLTRVAILGKRVEDFLESDIGQYLIGRAEEQYETAVNKLMNTSPWRRKRVQELQNEARLAGMFNRWLAEAIQNGHQAIQLIDEE